MCAKWHGASSNAGDDALLTGLGCYWSLQGLFQTMPDGMSYNASWHSLFFHSRDAGNHAHTSSLCVQREARSEVVVNRTLVSAHLTDWATGSSYPVAQIRTSLGQAGLSPIATARHRCMPLHKACHNIGAAKVPRL